MLGAAYGYDAVNRLTSATAAGGPGASGFTYDAYGRLITTTTGAATTRFQYAGEQLAAEYDAATGALLRRHIPGLGLDGTIVSYAGAGTTNAEWLLADERGSVIALTDGMGAAFNINRYDDYGVPAAGNMGRFQYTGQQWLEEAGAYHYRARTYLPQIGRFLQTDPIGYQAGANLYAYVGGDPVNMVDPWGLSRLPKSIPCPSSLDDALKAEVAGRFKVRCTMSYYEVFGNGNGFLFPGAGSIQSPPSGYQLWIPPIVPYPPGPPAHPENENVNCDLWRAGDYIAELGASGQYMGAIITAVGYTGMGYGALTGNLPIAGGGFLLGDIGVIIMAGGGAVNGFGNLIQLASGDFTPFVGDTIMRSTALRFAPRGAVRDVAEIILGSWADYVVSETVFEPCNSR